jgi:hypothetical protein
MNTQSNATAPPLRAESVVSADTPALRQFYSLVQREIWEAVPSISRHWRLPACFSSAF